MKSLKQASSQLLEILGCHGHRPMQPCKCWETAISLCWHEAAHERSPWDANPMLVPAILHLFWDQSTRSFRKLKTCTVRSASSAMSDKSFVVSVPIADKPLGAATARNTSKLPETRHRPPNRNRSRHTSSSQVTRHLHWILESGHYKMRRSTPQISVCKNVICTEPWRSLGIADKGGRHSGPQCARL